MIKFIHTVIFLLFLVVWSGVGHAEYVDLKQGGMIVAQQPCVEGGKQYLCVVVEFQDKLYIVALDQKGEAILWSIEGENLRKLWDRSHVSL
jgi:hypothetical protein